MPVGRLKTETQLLEFIKDELDLGALLSRQSNDASLIAALTARFPVADLDLASPNNQVYRPVVAAAGAHGTGATGSIYLPRLDTSIVASGAAAARGPVSLWIASADYLVAGKTTKLNLRVVHLVNNVAPVANFTYGLYPITMGVGTATGPLVTAGAVVAGSTAVVNAPGANSGQSVAGADFTLPADGHYAIGYTVSATPGAGHLSTFQATLRMRHT